MCAIIQDFAHKYKLIDGLFWSYTGLEPILSLSLQLVLLRAKKNFPHFIGSQNFINDLTKLVSSQTLAHVQIRVCLMY